MKKAARKKLIEWTINGLLIVLVAVLAWHHFGPGKQQATRSGEARWSELSVVATVEVADDEQTIARGLMGRDALPRDSGMYFVYKESAVRTFWMKNTRIPLSIAFIDADGVIASIKDMEPFDETLVSSEVEVKDALEMNQGWFAANDVRKSDRAELKDGQVHFYRRTRR